MWSDRRDSNSQQPAWKAGALPIELLPHMATPTGIEPVLSDVTDRCFILLNYITILEPKKGIEPSPSVWKTEILTIIRLRQIKLSYF